jgi:hypothetical protein
MLNDDIRSLALKVAQALENPGTWCRVAGARNHLAARTQVNDPNAIRWCALGHAYRLGGEQAAYDLAHAYWVQFRTDITADNDRYDDGRELVRDRLLELANS